MLYTIIHRNNILRHLPLEKPRVLEIGVKRGLFSEHILKSLDPSELVLLDPWEYQNDFEYQADTSNAMNEKHNEFLAEVHSKFENEIKDGKVKIERGYSPDHLSVFPDEHFDMIYVDGMHYHSAVLADLNAAARKVKADGVIMGHDFCEHSFAAAGNFGVITAVQTFLARNNDFTLLFITHERNATFGLIRKGNEAFKNVFISSLIKKKVDVLELPDAIVGAFHHWGSGERDEKNRQIFIPSFAL